MRLKYQLRGLGIGIVITAALLMGFSDKGDAADKTDDMTAMESIEAETAQEESRQTIPEVSTQDWIEDNAEDSNAEGNNEETQEAVTQEMSVSEEETAVDVEAENASEQEQTSEMVMEADKQEEMKAEETEAGESESETEHTDAVIIKIVSGDDSGTVARKLQVAGLIENASEYDAYLMQHGFDKKISVGTVEIEKGSTWLEIAQKLSERK